MNWGNFTSGVTIENFSFTDGVDVWTPKNTTLGGTAYVNPNGTFADWSFGIALLGSNGGSIATSQTEYSNFYNEDKTPLGDSWYASWLANPYAWDRPKGSFTISDGDHNADDPVSTPEPGTLALLGVGLAGLLARKTK